MDVQAFLKRKDVRSVLYAGNAAWHTSAFYYFMFRAPGIIRKSSTGRNNKHAEDIMNFLGAINVGYAVLALLRLRRILLGRRKPADQEKEEDRLALTTLGTANASQFWLDIMAAKYFEGRWPGLGGWDLITVIDGIFTMTDFGWALLA